MYIALEAAFQQIFTGMQAAAMQWAQQQQQQQAPLATQMRDEEFTRLAETRLAQNTLNCIKKLELP